jgi:hypothetical protein
MAMIQVHGFGVNEGTHYRLGKNNHFPCINRCPYVGRRGSFISMDFMNETRCLSSKRIASGFAAIVVQTATKPYRSFLLFFSIASNTPFMNPRTNP